MYLNQSQISYYILERILPFKIYNHLFFCDRGLRSVYDLCVRVLIQEKTIYYLFRKKIILNKDIFSPTFIDIYLPGNINMFGCQNRRDSFDTFLGRCSKGITENHYFLFKRYFEILLRVFFNSIRQKVYPNLSWIFIQNKPK